MPERVWHWVAECAVISTCCTACSYLCKSGNSELRPEVGQAITASGSHASHLKGSIHNLSKHHELGAKYSNTQPLSHPNYNCPADISCLSSHQPPVTRASAGTERGTPEMTVPSRIIVPSGCPTVSREETKGLAVDQGEITFI